MSLPSRCGATVEREADGFVWIRTEAHPPACGSCERNSACAVAGEVGEGQLLYLPNVIHAKPGDRVVVEVAAGLVWQAAWQTYVRPLAIAILAALLTRHFSGSDGWAFVAMLTGLVAGFLLLSRRGLDSKNDSPIFSLKPLSSGSDLSSR